MNTAPEHTSSLSFLSASLVIATIALTIVGAFSAEPVAASAPERPAAQSVPGSEAATLSASGRSDLTPPQIELVIVASGSAELTKVSGSVPRDSERRPPAATTAVTDPVSAVAEPDQSITADVPAISPDHAVAEMCTISVSVDARLNGPAASALAALNAELVNVRLVLAGAGQVSVAFGGEWPTDQAPLGWTDPSRRSILLNPQHPGSTMDAALADVIAHELGHVLISPDHVDDGTILDPRLDGQIRIGDADREALARLTCDGIGF